MFYFVLPGYAYVHYKLFLNRVIKKYKYRNLAVNRCQPLYNTLISVQHCILFQLKSGYIT